MNEKTSSGSVRQIGRNDYNYSPLSKPVSRQEIDTFRADHPEAVYSYLGVIGPVFLIALVFIGFIFATNLESANKPILPIHIFDVIALSAGLGYGAYRLMQRSVAKKVKLENFAKLNRMKANFGVKNPDKNGFIFRNEVSSEITESIKLIRLNTKVEWGNYNYTVGSGKRRTVLRYNFTEIELARPVPQMILDTRKNNFFGKLSNLPSQYSLDQKISLEGDFDKYFTLYAPLKYKRDALLIFTPDVMQALIKYGQDYDIELVGSSLYLYKALNIDLTIPDELTKILQVADILIKEVGKQTHSYTPSPLISARSEVPVTNFKVDENYLKKRPAWLGTIILIGVVSLLAVVPLLGRSAVYYFYIASIWIVASIALTAYFFRKHW